MSKHTPGPWNVRREGPTVIIEPIKASLCVLSGPPGYQAHQDANCALIAAAPDLLDALVDLLDENEHPTGDDRGDWDNCCRAAHAAIARARGEEAAA